jgi:hypothetical protein
VIDAMNRVEREARATVRGGSVFVDPDDPTYVTRQPPTVDKTVQSNCGKCGAPVVTACDSCKTAFPRPEGAEAGEDYPDPFCVGCGDAYPWAMERSVSAASTT